MAHLGELIAELRQDKGLTQKELGDILCVSSGTISNYENGVHLPDVDKVIALANFFHVTTDYLLGRTSSNLPVDMLQQTVTAQKTLGDVMASFAKLPANRQVALSLIISDMEVRQMIPIPASILAIENESDRDFMENIFFSYQRLIYHEIGSILNDPWSKDDIFQTVIVQLINNIDTLRPMPAKVLTSYIATSARNAALTYIRNISRRKEILADEFDNSNVDDDHDSDPEVILLKSEEINSFAKIWDELDDKTKFLLSSRYILEKSYAEIASDLNVKPESARMALTRARRAALTLSKKSHT